MIAWRLVLVGAALACLAASAAPVSAPPLPVLRVGTSGDYAPFSTISADGVRAGFDISLVTAFAAEHGYAIEWVPFRWPELTADVEAGRFDLAASGVTIRADRSLSGGFSVPIAETGAVVLARREAALEIDDLERPGLAMAVNAGGHLERVARLLFPAADLLAIPDNGAVLAALEAGEVDAIVSDSAEAVQWGASETKPVRFGPFTRDRKAWLIAPDRSALSAQIDSWLVDREIDGTLHRMRAGARLPTAGRPALPLQALLTAVAERLALMPAVAEAKRLSGAAVRVPEREEIVIANAVAGTRMAARSAGLPGPEDAAVEAFFGELIAAARAIQEAVLAGPAAAPGEAPDLDATLRPALLRIGERIGVLIPRIPTAIDEEAMDAAFAETVDLPGFGPDQRRRIVSALAGLASAPRR